jgi:hypothetical protein
MYRLEGLLPKRSEPRCRRFAGQNDRFFFIFHRFSVRLWREFRRPPVDARSKNFAARRKQGGFTPVCRFRAAEKGKAKTFGLDNRWFWQLKSPLRKMLTMKNRS